MKSDKSEESNNEWGDQKNGDAYFNKRTQNSEQNKHEHNNCRTSA